MKIEHVKFETFDDFYKEISFNGKYYNELKLFIFRGEDSKKYKLLPSALRENNRDSLFLLHNVSIDQRNWEYWQQFAEYSNLREFYKIANNNGLKIPNIDYFNEDYINKISISFAFDNVVKWIPKELAEIAALAQHYGTPTRLLDWTFDINTAIYFASKGACKKKFNNSTYDSNDSIVIWALNSDYIQFLYNTENQIPIKFVVPAYFNNPNINAQKGVLSYLECNRENTFSTNNTNRTPLDVILEDYCDRFQNVDQNITLLYKFELPISECLSAFKAINDLGYTAAKLFPGYNGVSETINDLVIMSKLQENNNSNI